MKLFNFGRVRDTAVNTWLDALRRLVNGLLTFTDNFNCVAVNVADTGTADTEFEATHDLDFTPDYYQVTGIDKGGVVYLSGTAWTSTKAYLKCTVANCDVDLLIGKK